MSTVHAVTRSVRDSAALLDAGAGPDVGDPYWAPPAERPYLSEVGRSPGRLRIGLQTRTFNGAETHPDCAAAARDAARLCSDLGHEVVEVSLEVDAEALGEAVQVVVGGNLRATLEDRCRMLGRELAQDDVEHITWLMAEGARSHGAAQYARAVRTLHAAGRRVGRFFAEWDVLLTPTMAVPPLLLGEVALSCSDGEAFLRNLRQTVGYTQLMNVAGNPAMSVPLSWSARGLPIGIQFAAGFGREATLFRLAGQLEEARPWAKRRPGGTPAGAPTAP